MKTKVTSNQLNKAFSVLEILETISGKSEREELLTKNRDNPALQSIILMTLGNDKYHIRLKFDSSLCDPTLTPKKSWVRFKQLAAKLNKRELTGRNESKDAVTELFIASDPTVVKWFNRILLHDLRVGIGRKTVSNIWGNQFLWQGDGGADKFQFRGCMLALAQKKLPKKHMVRPYPVGAELKLDGERFLCAVWPSQKRIEIVSRDNHRKTEIESCGPFVKQLVTVARKLSVGNDPIFLDGEFLSDDWNKTSSVISKSTNYTEKEFLDNVTAVLFDWAPLVAYEAGVFEMEWLARKNHLLGTLCDIDAKVVSPNAYPVSKNVAVLGHSIVESEEELLVFYDEACALGFEGAMSKILDGPAKFDNHRSFLIVKHKPEKELTGAIVKCLKGTGQHGPAEEQRVKKAIRFMNKYGDVKKTKYYVKVKVPDQVDGKSLEKELRVLTKDARDLRVYLKPNGWLTYRHSARLGRFVVVCDDKEFQVGTGIGHKNGADMRMQLWRRRKELKGMKMDFLHQPDPDPVAVMRFNSFVRLREDLAKELL